MEPVDTSIPPPSYEEELVDIDILTPENVQSMDDNNDIFEPRTNPPSSTGLSKETREQRREPQQEPSGTAKKSAPLDKPMMSDIETSKSQDMSDDESGINVVYVKNLSIATREEELENVLNAFGKVTKIDVIYDPHTKESRGFAFVEFETADDVNNALKNATDVQLRGKTLRLERARRGRPRSPTPGKYSGIKKGADRRRERDPYPYYVPPPAMSMYPYPPPYGYPPFVPPPMRHYPNPNRRQIDETRGPSSSHSSSRSDVSAYTPDDRRPSSNSNDSRSPKRQGETFRPPTRTYRDRSKSPSRDSYRSNFYPYMPYGYPPSYGMDPRMESRMYDYPRNYNGPRRSQYSSRSSSSSEKSFAPPNPHFHPPYTR
jgi:RNA recognition motif-containing protein